MVLSRNCAAPWITYCVSNEKTDRVTTGRGIPWKFHALAEKIGALLSTSAKGKDMFHGHSLNLGIIGSFSHLISTSWP